MAEFDEYAKIGNEMQQKSPAIQQQEAKVANLSKFVGPMPEPEPTTVAANPNAGAVPRVTSQGIPIPTEITVEELEKAEQAKAMLGADDLVINQNTPNTVRKLAAQADKMMRIQQARQAYEANPSQYDAVTANDLDGMIASWAASQGIRGAEPDAPMPTSVDPFAKTAPSAPVARPAAPQRSYSEDNYTPPGGSVSSAPTQPAAAPVSRQTARAAAPAPKPMTNQGPQQSVVGKFNRAAGNALKTGLNALSGGAPSPEPAQKQPRSQAEAERMLDAQLTKQYRQAKSAGMNPAFRDREQAGIKGPMTPDEIVAKTERYVVDPTNDIVRRRTDAEVGDVVNQEASKRQSAARMLQGVDQAQDILGAAGGAIPRSVPRSAMQGPQQTSGRVSNSPSNLYNSTPTSAPLKNPIKVNLSGKGAAPANKFAGVTAATKGQGTRSSPAAKSGGLVSTKKGTTPGSKGMAKTSAETALKASQQPKNVREKNLPARKQAIPMGSTSPAQNPAIPMGGRNLPAVRTPKMEVSGPPVQNPAIPMGGRKNNADVNRPSNTSTTTRRANTVAGAPENRGSVTRTGNSVKSETPNPPNVRAGERKIPKAPEARPNPNQPKINIDLSQKSNTPSNKGRYSGTISATRPKPVLPKRVGGVSQLGPNNSISRRENTQKSLATKDKIARPKSTEAKNFVSVGKPKPKPEKKSDKKGK